MPATTTVLVVDDEASIVEITQDILESRGYRVLATTNPERVLALLDEDARPIDVLLVDVMMPQMPGHEVAAMVYQRWPACRVIFMSGYAPENLPERGGLPPGSHVLSKPISLEGLVNAVRTALAPRILGAG